MWLAISDFILEIEEEGRRGEGVGQGWGGEGRGGDRGKEGEGRGVGQGWGAEGRGGDVSPIAKSALQVI